MNDRSLSRMLYDKYGNLQMDVPEDDDYVGWDEEDEFYEEDFDEYDYEDEEEEEEGYF